MRQQIYFYQTIRLHLRSVTRTEVFIYPEDSKEIFVFLLMTKHSGRYRLLLFLVWLRVITRLLVRLGPHIVVSHQLCYGLGAMCQQICL